MTQIIDQLPLPVPSRTDPTNFSVRADNFLGELPDFATQVNALATELTALGNTVETNKNTAVTAANNAQASAFAATGSANNAASSSGAALWVSGTTYSIGNLVYSPITGRTYRRKIAGAGTTDPSADATNWIPIVLEISTQYPTTRPSLNLDFVNNKYLDPRITFTRSSTAKYFDGKTVHKAEENLLIRSEEFDNAAWVKTNTTVTANTQVNPFGQSTSETLTETTANATHGLYQSIGIVTGTAYTFSVYAKYSTRQHIQLLFDGAGWSTSYANFDIQNGTIGTVAAGVTASIDNAGNGWYRCKVTATSIINSAAAGLHVVMANSSSMGYYGSYTGSTSNSVYIFGAQVEQRSSVGPYQATTTQPLTNYQSTLVTAAINQPRFDHDPVTKECKGLLIEDATTNLLTYSEDFGNAAWTKSNSIISGDFTYAPDGTKSADKLIEDNTTGSHYVFQSITPTNGVTYSFSIAMKADQRRYVWLGCGFSGGGRYGFDLLTGTLTNGTISNQAATVSNLGNGWYRCSITVTASSNAVGQLQIGMDGDADNVTGIGYTGDGYSGIYIWGAQLEANSASPSSYVATSGATASRSYDNAVMTGTNFSSWYNQEEGSVYSEFKIDQKPLTGYFNTRIWALNNPSGNSLYSYIDAASGKMYHDVLYNGILTSTLQSSNVWSLNTLYRNSTGFKTNDVAVSYNSSIDTDMSNNIPKDISSLQIGAQATGTAPLRGHLRRFTYYPKKLTNQELQTLTAI